MSEAGVRKSDVHTGDGQGRARRVLPPYRKLWPDARVLPVDGANFEPDRDAANFAAGLASFLRKIFG